MKLLFERDPKWNVGTTHLLSLSHDDPKLAEPAEYRVSSKEQDDDDRWWYELTRLGVN